MPKTAGQIMTRNPISADPLTTIREAIDLLESLEVRHLPVCETTGELIGMISDRDLNGAARPYEMRPSDSVWNEPASSVMTSNVISVDAETEIDDMIDLMLEHRIGALPVVDIEENTLIGIVSYVDLLRALKTGLSEKDATEMTEE